MQHRWYAVHTQPQRESLSVFHLQRQGFDVYLPKYRKVRRHARKTEEVAAPLFPRYLFVRMDITATRWRAIHSTVGVSRLVCNGETPCPIDDEIIDAIRAHENEAGLIVLATQSALKTGQPVHIAAGPMADLDGIFECYDDKERVTVLLDLLGRETRVRVPLEAVRAVA